MTAFFRLLKLSTLCCLLLSSGLLYGQRPGVPRPGGGGFPGGGGGGGFPGGGGQGGELIDDFIDTDSLVMPYIFKENPQDTFYRGDTTKYAFYHIYDPARRRDWDYIHVGMPGSAARPVYFSLPYQEGNHLGVHVFDPYVKRAKSLAFFQPERPYADLTFLRGADQDDFVFEAIFSHTFANGLNFSMDYHRMGQIGDYRRQRLRNTALTFGLSYSWWNDKVQSYFVFVNNGILQENSGGIRDENVFNDPRFNIRANIEVQLQNSRTRFEVREYELYNSFEAPFTTRFPLRLYNSLMLSSERFLFFEDGRGSPLDPEYFGIFLNDVRGVRHGVQMNKFRNEIGLQWEAQNLAGLDVESIKGGLIQNWINWAQEPNTRSLNEILLFGEANLTLFNRVITKGIFQQGILDAAGSSHILLEGKLLLPWQIKLLVTYERSGVLPSLIDRSVNISFRNIYTTDFSPQRINNIKGGLRWDKTRTTLETGILRGLDMIVYDARGIPEQLGDAANVLQVSLKQEIRISHFQWHNYFLLQVSDQTKLGIPPWFYKSSLFYEREVFRGKSPLRIGADFRSFSDYFGLSYFPLHAQWVWQDESAQRFFPEVDVFIAMKVKVFRAFVRFENLLGTFNNVPLIHHHRYPMHEQRLCLGIHWILQD